MVAMCIWIDGFVLLKVAGSIKTVHGRGISLSGTWRMPKEGFDDGAKISVHICRGTLVDFLFASMSQNMASSDGTRTQLRDGPLQHYSSVPLIPGCVAMLPQTYLHSTV